MNTRYFLGANSQKGFVSLYDQFAAGEGDRLHVIKGGPGTGKSGFMRALGAAAEKRGYEVEYVLCSGDPDSLDGVYLPALGLGWVDGTAPHTAEPAHFGADGAYEDLGRFCRLPLSAADRERVLQLSADYKALYARAYDYLAAGAALDRACRPSLRDAALREAVCRRVDSLLRRQAAGHGDGRERRRFLSALSCRGRLYLTGELQALCPRVYLLDDGLRLAGPALRHAAAEAERRGLERIVCPSPLAPEEPEALLLPKAGLALLRGDWPVAGARHIRLDALLPAPARQALRGELRAGEKLARAAMDAGLDKLRQAKKLHDELEAVYRPYMDFAALSAYTEETITRLFG